MQLVPAQGASVCGAAAFSIQVGQHRHGVSLRGLRLDLSAQGTARQSAVQLLGTDTVQMQHPCPASRGLLALALHLATGDARLQLLHLPQGVTPALQLDVQRAQGQTRLVPRARRLVAQTGLNLPILALWCHGCMTVQRGLWRTGPQGSQIEPLPVGLGLRDALLLPGVNLGVQLHLHARA